MEWRLLGERQEVATQIAELQDDARQSAELQESIRQQQAELSTKVDQVQRAATEAGLLFVQNGETIALDARLGEIDTLRLELAQIRREMETQLQDLEQSVIDQVANQGRETAQAIALELRWKSLAIKAQGEVLLSQIYWAEGNRGLARDELAIAHRSLTQAQQAAPEQIQERMRSLLTMSEQARSALILEQAGARDSLNLLWHRVSELLTAQGS